MSVNEHVTAPSKIVVEASPLTTVTLSNNNANSNETDTDTTGNRNKGREIHMHSVDAVTGIDNEKGKEESMEEIGPDQVSMYGLKYADECSRTFIFGNEDHTLGNVLRHVIANQVRI